MGRKYIFTPARRAALKRAQAKSAALRRKGAGKNGTTNFYGKGRKGRRAAKRATYGSKKHGLSIAQQDRRRRRSNRRKKVVRTVATGGAIAVSMYTRATPEQKQSIKDAAKRAKKYGRKRR